MNNTTTQPDPTEIYTDLHLTQGSHLRPGETTCNLCHDPLTRDHQSITHSPCRRSWHRNCLIEFNAGSRLCFYCRVPYTLRPGAQHPAPALSSQRVPITMLPFSSSQARRTFHRVHGSIPRQEHLERIYKGAVERYNDSGSGGGMPDLKFFANAAQRALSRAEGQEQWMEELGWRREGDMAVEACLRRLYAGEEYAKGEFSWGL